MTASPLLSFDNVTVQFDRASEKVRAVRAVSFSVMPGEVFGLVGESGSGKTSLARCILGLAPLSAGQVLWRGGAIRRGSGSIPRETRRRIQYVFQDPAGSLSPRRTVRQTLLEPIALYGSTSAGNTEDLIADALESVDLDASILNRLPHQVSGGQAQRVAIARALLAQPELLIADEPTSALDVTVQARLISLLLRLRQTRGIAILLISHDLAVVNQLADRIGVMYRGELLEIAPAADLFARPSHPYTQALLRAVPSLDPRQRITAVMRPAGDESSLTPPLGCVFHNHCPDAMPVCLSEKPEAHLVGLPGDSGPHFSRCHLCKA